MSRTGEPVLVDYSHRDTWHTLIIAPPDSGASELVRTLVSALALTNSPQELMLSGIDIGGNELALMEAIPHNHWELATNLPLATTSLEWLEQLCDVRQQSGQRTPHVFLVVDDLTIVLDQAPELASNLHSLIKDGPSAGIHLIASVQWPLAGSQRWLNGIDGMKVTVPGEKRGANDLSPGRFVLSTDGHSIELDTAWLPAQDLQQVVARCQEQWKGE